jgi:hypothetical protein
MCCIFHEELPLDSYTRVPQHVTEFEGILPCSQEPSTVFYQSQMKEYLAIYA